MMPTLWSDWPAEATAGSAALRRLTAAPVTVRRIGAGGRVAPRVLDGENCEIPGVGPIPVDVARRLAVDSFLSVLITDGVDVTTATGVGRTIPAAVRRALLERDQCCVVPGCGLREALEIDHIDPFGQGGPTRLENLCRLCRWHHYLKTHQGHRIERSGAGWRWIAPAGPAKPETGPDQATLDLSG
jgi:5-methylcytosine-specific restriction endonuclease McrA